MSKKTLPKKVSLDKFSDKDKQDLKKMVLDPGVDFDDILKDARYADLTQRQIRAWAKKNGYKVRMNGHHKPVKKTRPYAGRLGEIIQTGALKAKGLDWLFDNIKGEFPDSAHGLNKKLFLSVVEELIWTKEVESQLKNIVGHELPL